MQKLSSAKILVVDDNQSNVVLLEKMLGNAGYHSVHVTTEPLTVRTLHARERFDLILLDLQMPELDGFGVMRELGELGIEDYLPILVLTAQGDSATRARALREGAKDFVTKPFEVDEVLSRVANMLEVRLLYNLKREQNEVLEEMVRDRTKELRETNLQIVRYLGRAAEYRDTETGMHVIRMSATSALLGQAIGMNKAECELLLNASPMHDLGKIGIPDRILLKEGTLDQKEWEIMKTHTLIGAEILSGHNSEVLEMAGIIALSHHERWDGSGYPNGLVGEEIPIVGRVTTVCDVFDALTSERPYKRAWSVEAAVDFIRSGSGTLFDPGLVGVFVGILPEALAIRSDYPDPRTSRQAPLDRQFANSELRLMPRTWKPLKLDVEDPHPQAGDMENAEHQVSELNNLDARR